MNSPIRNNFVPLDIYCEDVEKITEILADEEEMYLILHDISNAFTKQTHSTNLLIQISYGDFQILGTMSVHICFVNIETYMDGGVCVEIMKKQNQPPLMYAIHGFYMLKFLIFNIQVLRSFLFTVQYGKFNRNGFTCEPSRVGCKNKNQNIPITTGFPSISPTWEALEPKITLLFKKTDPVSDYCNLEPNPHLSGAQLTTAMISSKQGSLQFFILSCPGRQVTFLPFLSFTSITTF